MGSAESVKEIQERNASFQSRKMGDGGKIHYFLYAAFRKNSCAGLTTSVNIRMIAKDREGMGGNGSCRHMNDARQQFSGHTIKVWKHEQKSL